MSQCCFSSVNCLAGVRLIRRISKTHDGVTDESRQHVFETLKTVRQTSAASSQCQHSFETSKTVRQTSAESSQCTRISRRPSDLSDDFGYDHADSKPLCKKDHQISVHHLLRDKTKTFSDFYEEREVLGEGTFGKVVRCTRKNNLDSGMGIGREDVAVKQLFSKKFKRTCCWKSDREADELTRAELEVHLLLDHPNIIEFHEWFENENGHMYFVMELIKGEPLHYDFVRICEIDDEETRWNQLPMMQEYFYQILCGVSYLHSFDPVIIHRDLKPDNIMVVKGDASNYSSHLIKIIDFGLVVNHGTTYCNNGTRLGTRLFMAPEYILFKSGHMSPALDMWSLGIIFAWIMTSLKHGKMLHPLLKEDEGGGGYAANEDQACFRRLKSAMVHGRNWNGQLYDGRLWTDEGGHYAGLSHDALDILGKLLLYTPDESEEVPERASAAEILGTKWVQQAVAEEDDDTSDTMLQSPLSGLNLDVLKNIKAFRGLEKLDRLILSRSAQASSDKEVTNLRKIFISLDSNFTGRLSKEEFCTALQQADDITDEESLDIYYSITKHDDGVDWNGFKTAGIGINILKNDDAKAAAFQFFDVNKTGRVTKECLELALGQKETKRLMRKNSVFANIDSESIGQDKFNKLISKIIRKRTILMTTPYKRKSSPNINMQKRLSDGSMASAVRESYRKMQTAIGLDTVKEKKEGPRWLERLQRLICCL